MKRYKAFLTVILLILLCSCGSGASMELNGIVLAKEKERLLLVEYPPQGQNIPMLYWIRTAKADQVEVGQKVKAVPDSGVQDSFPGQTSAKSVQVDRAFADKERAVRHAIDKAKELEGAPHYYFEKIDVAGDLGTLLIREYGSPKPGLEIVVNLKTDQNCRKIITRDGLYELRLRCYVIYHNIEAVFLRFHYLFSIKRLGLCNFK